MTLSQEIQSCAGEVVMMSTALYQRLCRLAILAATQETELAILREFADERGAEGQDAERSRAGLRPIGEIVEPIVARVERRT